MARFLTRLLLGVLAFAASLLLISLHHTMILPYYRPASLDKTIALASFKPQQQRLPEIAPLSDPVAVHASDFGGFHETTLTHIFFSLRTQEEVDLFSYAVHVYWGLFPPCAHWEQVFRCENAQGGDPAFPTKTPKPKLVIFLLEAEGEEVEELDLRALRGNLKAHEHCFSPSGPSFVKVHGDAGLSPSELVLAGACRDQDHDPEQEVGYGLFVPVQSRPSQPGWITHIAKSVLFPVPLYWVILPFQMRFPVVDAYPIIILRLSTHATRNSPASSDGFAMSCGQLPLPTLRAENASFPQVFFTRIRPQAQRMLRRMRGTLRAFSVQDQLHAFLYYYYKHEYELVRMQLASRVHLTRLFASHKQSIPKETVLYSKQHVDLWHYEDAFAQPLPRQFVWEEHAPGYHTSWLSHVVFALPNVPSQFDRLKHTLSVWWSRFPPCHNAPSGRGDYDMLARWQSNTCAGEKAHASALPRKPTLVFMVSRRSFYELAAEADRQDALLRTRIQNEVISLLLPSSTRCFAEVKICIVRFTQRIDTYLTGSRILFERLLGGECTPDNDGDGSHALYIEPDARPVRAGWLTSLSASVIFPNPTSWIVGAIFRGDGEIARNPNYPKFWYFHFNGNGIYQIRQRRRAETGVLVGQEKLRGMDTFSDYYFSRVRHYISWTLHWETAMDMDIVDYAFAMFDVVAHDLEWRIGKENYHALVSRTKYRTAPRPRWQLHLPRAVNRFASHCRFTDLIVNKYHSDWTYQDLVQNSDAQLVHGGFCGEACQ